MDAIVSSNNYPVNVMTAPVSGLINDLNKAIKTKSSQRWIACGGKMFILQIICW